MRLDLTKLQVHAIVTMLRDDLGEDGDERLKLDALEGETDLFEVVRQLLDEIERDEGNGSALAAQIDERKARADAAIRRIGARRKAIMALMETAGLDRLPMPEATLSVRRLAPKPIVTDEAAIPDALCKFTRKPDVSAIKSALQDGPVPGVSLDNGGASLTIRRK